MARLKILTSVLALSLAAGASYAQDNTRTVRVVEPGQAFGKNVVRAQFIRPGDVSPEEYSRLLAEADRIRSYQATNGSMATPVTYNAASSASTAELAPQPYAQYQAQQAQTYSTVSSPAYVTTPAPAATYTQGQTYYANSGQPYYTAAQSVTSVPTYQAPVYQAPRNTAAYTAAATSPLPTTTYSTPIAAHNVMKGDTLYNISKRYGVALSHLKEANRLTSNNIRLGQILTIPSVQKTAATTYLPAQTGSYTQSVQTRTYGQPTRTTQSIAPTQSYGTTYVRNVQAVPRSGVYAVLPKDTLFSIARFACVSPADVAQINGISNASALQPGQKLTMPSGHCLN